MEKSSSLKSNNVPPALAAVFNKIVVDYKTQKQAQQERQLIQTPPMERDTDMLGGVLGRMVGKRKANDDYEVRYAPTTKKIKATPATVLKRRPVIPALNLQGLGQGFLNMGPRGARRAPQMRALKNGSWHPLARVKNAIADMLPAQYSSRYRLSYNFGPGRPSGTTTATKIKWRKLLGDVFSINGMGRLRYTKGTFKAYANQKIQRRAIGRRAFYRV